MSDFNWSDKITIPNLNDIINTSDTPINILRVFTYLWVWFLGGWFFAGVIGVLAASLYVKYDNAMIPAVFLILSVILLGGVFTATPVSSGLPAAEVVRFILGVIIAFVIGLAFYMVFVNKGE